MLEHKQIICINDKGGTKVEEGILKQLERTRELMIRSGIENGLRNAKTIRLSRQLDRLMNKYAKQQKQNENRIDNQLMN